MLQLFLKTRRRLLIEYIDKLRFTFTLTHEMSKSIRRQPLRIYYSWNEMKITKVIEY